MVVPGLMSVRSHRAKIRVTIYREDDLAAKLLDGRALAEEIRAEVTEGVTEMQEKHGVTPGLAAMLVGDDPASAVYVRNKRRACEQVGMFSETFLMPTDSSPAAVLDQVKSLNADPRFHGILVQLPLPRHVDEQKIIEELDPDKDVDGLHPYNTGRLLQGRPIFVPGTPAGIQQLLLRNGCDPAGAHVVVCGRSDIVGKPLAALLMQRQEGANATVTVCHTRTRGLSRDYPPGRHSSCRSRQAKRDHSRHGEGRGGRSGRGHQPGRRRDPPPRVPLAGRRGLRQCSRESQSDHSGARRRGADDHSHAAGEYPHCRPDQHPRPLKCRRRTGPSGLRPGGGFPQF